MDTRERRRPPAERGNPRGNRQQRPEQARKRPARKSNVPSVVYTDPRPFNGKKLILQLLTVVAIVLAVMFGMSIFFKVDLDKATVAGNEKYTVNEIIEASGIRDGANLLTLSDAKISGSITAKLPYVNYIRVGIKLPDMVHIEVTELSVPYAVEAEDGSWWLMGADGRVVDSISTSESKTYTRVLGLKVQVPKVGQTAIACEPERPEITMPPTEDGQGNSGETTENTDAVETEPEESGSSEDAGKENGETKPVPSEVVAIRGSDLMVAALNVLQQLEKNGILGEVASVDVTDLTAIELWYGSRYQVSLGGTERMDYKISLLKSAIRQMGRHQSGQLDISFTTWPDQVGYTPFA